LASRPSTSDVGAATKVLEQLERDADLVLVAHVGLQVSRVTQLGGTGHGLQRVGAEHEDVQLTRSDLAEDRVPPALAARELAIDPDLPLRPLDVAGEHIDGVLVLAGIAMKTVMATLVPSLLWSHAS
jgi:hypothetical protein